MRSHCTAVSRTASNFLEAGARSSTRRCRYQATHHQRHLSTRPTTQHRHFSSSPSPSSPSIPNLSQRTTPRRCSVLRTLNTRRAFSTTPLRQHGDITPPKPGEERKVTFIDKEGHEHTFEVADGDNLLDIAQANDLEMEGACGGSCACSTCHVIVQSDEMYDKMEEPSDDENDMLDLAFGLTETSRLGCQVLMSKELDGLVVKLPSMTRNMQASDFADK